MIPPLSGQFCVCGLCLRSDALPNGRAYSCATKIPAWSGAKSLWLCVKLSTLFWQATEIHGERPTQRGQADASRAGTRAGGTERVGAAGIAPLKIFVITTGFADDHDLPHTGRPDAMTELFPRRFAKPIASLPFHAQKAATPYTPSMTAYGVTVSPLKTPAAIRPHL